MGVKIELEKLIGHGCQNKVHTKDVCMHVYMHVKKKKNSFVDPVIVVGCVLQWQYTFLYCTRKQNVTQHMI